MAHAADFNEKPLRLFEEVLKVKPQACLGVQHHDSKACSSHSKAFGVMLQGKQSYDLLLQQDQHWAVQHEAMQSFVAYARSPSSEDFREVIPVELLPGGLLNTATARIAHVMLGGPIFRLHADSSVLVNILRGRKDCELTVVPCSADDANPQRNAFLELMIQYMHRTGSDPKRSSAAKDCCPSQWATGEAVGMLEEHSSSRVGRLKQLSELAKMQPVHCAQDCTDDIISAARTALQASFPHRHQALMKWKAGLRI